MAELDDQPLDPDATDQLAAAMGGPPPVDASLVGAPAAAGPWSWIPPSWSAPVDPMQPPVDMGPMPGQAPPPIATPLDAGAPPSMPLPDAISGADGTPLGFAGPVTPTPTQRYSAVAQRNAEHPDQLLEQLISGSVDDDTQQYLNELAQRDPQGFVELNTRLGDAKIKNLAAEHARIADRDWEQQQANIAMRNQAIADAQAKSAMIDAEAQRLSETKLGPHFSTFERVAGVMMGVIGGLYQGATGGSRNIGLDALNDIVNREIDTQRAELSNKRELLGMRRNALGEQYARSGDIYQASETLRLAALKHADEVLATQQQNFAPDGTRGLQIAQLRAGIAGQQQQARSAVEQKMFDNSLKAQNAAREQQLADSTVAKNAAEAAKLRAEASSVKADRQVWSPEQLAAINAVGGKPAPAPPIPMSQKDYKQWVETQGATQQNTAAAGRNELERSIGGGEGPITMKDGKVWIPRGTEAQITKLQDQTEASLEVIGTLDAIRREGPEWLSNTRNSDKLQRLKQLGGTLRVQAIRAARLGVPTGHDVDLADAIAGTDDPTRLRGSLAGIGQARETYVRNMNVGFKVAGLDHPWAPPDLGQKGTTKQPGDERVAPLFENPAANGTGQWETEIEAANPALGKSKYTSLKLEAGKYREAFGDILPSQRALIDQLTNEAASPDPKISGPATEFLQEAASRGGTKTIKSYAQQGLEAAIGEVGMRGPTGGK